jgi:exosortase
MAALGVGLIWSYWPMLRFIVGAWPRDPIHDPFGPAHGAFVPVYALVVLWSRRHCWKGVPWQPTWWGLPLLAAAMLLRVLAGALRLVALDAYSMLPTLVGFTLLLGGRPLWRGAWPAIALLALALPLPYRMAVVVSLLLRQVVTAGSTSALQALGWPAFAEETVIHLPEMELQVADECSGLGMLQTFVALAAALAACLDRPVSDRIVLVLSAVPIAVIANVARVTATAVAYALAVDEGTRFFMHELAGWLMMPLAVGLLWLLSHYLKPLAIAARFAGQRRAAAARGAGSDRDC